MNWCFKKIFPTCIWKVLCMRPFSDFGSLWKFEYGTAFCKDYAMFSKRKCKVEKLWSWTGCLEKKQNSYGSIKSRH